MKGLCVGLSLRHPKNIVSHSWLNLILSQMAPFNEGISWLRQNWLPILDTPDEVLAKMTEDWGMSDDRFPADTDRLSSRCHELARSCNRHVSMALRLITNDLLAVRIST